MLHLVKRDRLYSVRIRLDGWPSFKQYALRTTDLLVANEKASELLRKLERQARGILPSDSALDAASRPILAQLPAFLADIEARERSVNTIKAYRKCIPNLCRDCGWEYFSDVSSESFEIMRSGARRSPFYRPDVPRHSAKAAAAVVVPATGGAVLWSRRRSPNAGGSRAPAPKGGAREAAAVPPSRKSLSPKYLNDLLGYMRSFIHWSIRRRLLEDDPLKFVQAVSIKRGRGHRRAFTVDELRHFLSVVPAHRASVYRAAYYLGLRRWELNGLKRGDFDLDSNPPVVRIPGTVAKNRRFAQMELHPELVASLRTFWPSDMSPFVHAFHGRVPNMDTWKRDLSKAGIVLVDGEGRRLDFHSLRHTLCTHLRIAAVSKRDALAIMRLSSEKLLDQVYMDDGQLSVGSQIAKLPFFGAPGLSHGLSHGTAFSGQKQS